MVVPQSVLNQNLTCKKALDTTGDDNNNATEPYQMEAISNTTESIANNVAMFTLDGAAAEKTAE